jgi:hypothetical protein
MANVWVNPGYTIRIRRKDGSEVTGTLVRLLIDWQTDELVAEVEVDGTRTEVVPDAIEPA